MVSALAFFVYKHKTKTHDESRKLVGDDSQRVQDSSTPPPPSTFLYIGTVEPSNRTALSEVKDGENGVSSPYRKLRSAKRSDWYRPSPDLQPLPPLPKQPPLLPTLHSPPPMSSSSSDEESQEETVFYTPQGSSVSVVSNDEGSFTSGSRWSYKSNNTNTNCVVPHSKRTSPKSRLFQSSSPQPTPPPPLPPARPAQPLTQITYGTPTSFSPTRPKFAPPPPPPNMARLQAITIQSGQTSKIPPPPPLPPPPPPLLHRIPPSSQRKAGGSETGVPLVHLQELRKSISRIQNSKANYGVEKTRTVEEVGKSEGAGSLERGDGDDAEGSRPKLKPLERGDGDDADGSRPKLKPLHWDKVRATSGRATVWDQLKSSSFQ